MGFFRSFIPKSLLFLLFFGALAWAGPKPSELASDEEKAAYYEKAASVISAHREEIRGILMKISGGTQGADYEIHQAIRALQGMKSKELGNLAAASTLQKIGVFGSSNIPLYSLVLHAIAPSTAAQEIYYKSASVTEKEYRALFDILMRGLGENYDLSDIHLMGSDRKQFFEKLMPKGKGASAPNLLIYTGSSEKADGIISDLEKQISSRLGQAGKLVFLKLCAGINPIFVDSSANELQVEAAARASTEHIFINGGQDCIAPNFSAIPSEKKGKFIEEVRKELKGIRAGAGPSARVPPLVFSTKSKLAELKAFRDRYSEFLLDPSARILVDEHLVDPHAFVIPWSEFKKRDPAFRGGPSDLREHYAPFSTVLTYENPQELMEILEDKRLPPQAMYASIFGDPLQSHAIESKLTETKHQVIFNRSVFTFEDGNAPFGGFGRDASAITVINVKPGPEGAIETQERAEPILLSKVIKEEFPRSQPATPVLLTLPAGHELEARAIRANAPHAQVHFNVSVKVNVSQNPLLVRYYKPKLIPDGGSPESEKWVQVSDQKWRSFSEAKRIELAKAFEEHFGKKEAARAYIRLTQSEPHLPKFLGSDQRGYFELKGPRFNEPEEAGAFLEQVRAGVGEGPVLGRISFDKKPIPGLSGFLRFESDEAVFSGLIDDFRGLHSGRISAEQAANDYVLHGRVSAPVLRVGEGNLAIHSSGKNSFNFLKRKLSEYSGLLSARERMKSFEEFEKIQPMDKSLVKERLESLIHSGEDPTAIERLRLIDLAKWSQSMGEGKAIDQEMSLRFYFPLRDWKEYPAFRTLSEQERAALGKIIDRATTQYLIDLDEVLKKAPPLSPGSLAQMKVALTKWSFGDPNTAKDEFMQIFRGFKKRIQQAAPAVSSATQNCASDFKKLLEGPGL